MSLYEAGTPALTWGEAIDLYTQAAADPSTPLGVEYAEFDYPASMRDTYLMMLLLMAFAPSEGAYNKLAKHFLPFDQQAGNRMPTADEYEQATAEFMARFGIPREKWAAEMDVLAQPYRDNESEA